MTEFAKHIAEQILQDISDFAESTESYKKIIARTKDYRISFLSSDDGCLFFVHVDSPLVRENVFSILKEKWGFKIITPKLEGMLSIILTLDEKNNT